jgi:hypothetical protein
MFSKLITPYERSKWTTRPKKKEKKKKEEDMFTEIITFFCIDKNSSAQGGAIDLVIY